MRIRLRLYHESPPNVRKSPLGRKDREETDSEVLGAEHLQLEQEITRVVRRKTGQIQPLVASGFHVEKAVFDTRRLI